MTSPKTKPKNSTNFDDNKNQVNFILLEGVEIEDTGLEIDLENDLQSLIPTNFETEFLNSLQKKPVKKDRKKQTEKISNISNEIEFLTTQSHQQQLKNLQAKHLAQEIQKIKSQTGVDRTISQNQKEEETENLIDSILNSPAKNFNTENTKPAFLNENLPIQTTLTKNFEHFENQLNQNADLKSNPEQSEQPKSKPAQNPDLQSELKATQKPDLKPILAPFLNPDPQNQPKDFQNQITKTTINTLPKNNPEKQLENLVSSIVHNQLHQEIQAEVQAELAKQTNKGLQNWFVVGSAIMIAGLMLINLGWFLNSSNPTKTTQNQETTFVAQAKQPQNPAEKTYTISNFISDPAVIEVQTQLVYKSTEISTQSSPNCMLTTPAPDQNNCSFMVSPALFNLNQEGLAFLGISFEGSITDEGKILIESRDIEKNQTIKVLNTAEKFNFDEFIPFQEPISSREVLNFRFWQKSDNLKITKINLKYITADDLKSVGGKVDLGSNNTSLNAKIYRDVDENLSFNQIDKPWVCNPEFPGVLPVQLNNDGTFILQRDDSCYKYNPPGSWNGDSKRRSLPAGKWLMVFEDGKAISFEIKNQEQSFENEQLNLKI
jgi:hypothetical protein